MMTRSCSVLTVVLLLSISAAMQLQLPAQNAHVAARKSTIATHKGLCSLVQVEEFGEKGSKNLVSQHLVLQDISLGDSGLEVNLQDVTIPTALIYLEPPTIDFPVFAGEDDTSLWMLTNDTSGKYLLRVVETAPTPEGSKKIGSLGSLSVEKTEDNEVVFSFRGRCFPVEDQRVLALVSVIEDLGESVAKIHLSTDIKHAVLSYPSCSWIVIDEQRCKLPEEIMGFCVPGHKLGKPAVIYANESGVYRTCYSLKGHSCQATETEKLLSLDVSVYLSDYGANQHMCFLSQVDLCLFKSSAKAEYDMASVGYFEIHSADKSHQLDFDASQFLPSSKFGDRPRRVK